MKQFGPLDEFLKSTDLLAEDESDNTSRSKPWWRDTSEFTRRFLIWRPRDEHEDRHCQALQPHPHQGRDPIPRASSKRRAERAAWLWLRSCRRIEAYDGLVRGELEYV